MAASLDDTDTIEDVKVPCLLNRKIDNGRFQLTQRIGHGGYSVVYLALDLYATRNGSASNTRSPTRVAVKCLLERRKLKVAREVALHKRAASIPGVIKLFRTVHEGGLIFIVLEYVPHGDLFSAVTETRIFLGNDRLIKSVFLQLLDTVAGLHRKGIYHRDLKPENILCLTPVASLYNGTATTLRVLLADFGLATESERSQSFGCGSYFYMTPECLAGTYSSQLSAYSSRAADVWALGIILVNLVCGRSPWKTAMLSDPSFQRYSRNSRWLRSMLPLSVPAYRFLNTIFSNHGNNLRIPDLRAQFLSIDTFYMSPAELAVADKTARLVAREWMPEAPMHDIRKEDLAKMTRIDDVDEKQLFDDSIHVRNSGNSDSTKSTPPSSAGSSPFSSIDGLHPSGAMLTYSGVDTSSESDFPITPETKPIRPTEGVPSLPKGEQPVGDNWVLSTTELHSFHKVLAEQASPDVENASGIEELII